MTKSSRLLKVFICHASRDKPIIRELAQRLFNEGWIDPWLDEKKLLPGQNWRSQIEEAVEASDNVIICLSHFSVSKEGYVQKELRYAREIALEKPEGNIFLIPLRLNDCIVPRGLRLYQWGDYFGEKKEETYRVLLESLKFRREQKLQFDNEERVRWNKEKQEVEIAEELAHGKEEYHDPRKVLPQERELKSPETIKREQADRQIVQIVELKVILFQSFNAIRLAIQKTQPFFRIGVILGIPLGLLVILQIFSLIPTAQVNIPPNPSTSNINVNSPIPSTQAINPSSTPTFLPTATRTLAQDYLKGSEILFANKDGTIYSFSSNSYSKLGAISYSGWSNANGVLGDLVWSWNANKDIFLYGGPPSDRDVYFIDRTGAITSSLMVPYLNYCPNLSPDGKRILVVSQSTYPLSLWVLNADGSGFRRFTLSSDKFGFSCPAWSPDGKMIAAETSFGQGRYGVALLNLAGVITKQIDTPVHWNTPPKWSSNSRFLLLCDIYNGIVMLNIEDNDQEILLTDSVVDCDWSPDGNFIVYVSPTGLEVFDINTHTVVNLVEMIDIKAVAWK